MAGTRIVVDRILVLESLLAAARSAKVSYDRPEVYRRTKAQQQFTGSIMIHQNKGNPKQHVLMLLDLWERMIPNNRALSIKNAKRTYGSVDAYVFDNSKTIITNPEYKRTIDDIRHKISLLLQDRPEANEIMQDPVFVEKWKISDYIDLYYGYYETLIAKIRKVVTNL